MNTYYECRVKYTKIDQAGFEKTVNQPYLLDAVSYTEAEARIYEEISKSVKGEFVVKSIKESNIREILTATQGEYWWKARIQFVTFDEEACREKKISQYILVMGDNVKHAIENIEIGLAHMLVEYKIVSIAESQIVDVFPYDFEAAAAKLPAGERPENDVEESEGDDE